MIPTETNIPTRTKGRFFTFPHSTSECWRTCAMHLLIETPHSQQFFRPCSAQVDLLFAPRGCLRSDAPKRQTVFEQSVTATSTSILSHSRNGRHFCVTATGSGHAEGPRSIHPVWLQNRTEEEQSVTST